MSAPTPNFRKGGDAAQEAAAAQQGGRFARTEYVTQYFEEDGGQVVLRYLTDKDDWVYVDQHASAPTKNKPSDWPADRNWPQSMPAVCRYDEAFGGHYKDCYICDAELKNQWGRVSKPTVRIWALACVREEVIGTKEMVADGQIEETQIGKRIGYKDAIRMVAETDDKGEATGKEIAQRAVVVVNMAPSNYFNGLTSIASIYEGTVCDRDYVVKKTGSKKDSEYTHIPLDPTPNLKPGTEKWARYDEAIKEQNIDLGALVADRASDDFFARFFDPNKTPTPKEGSASSGSSSASKPDVPQAAETDVDSDRLAEMRARVRGNTGVSSASSEVD